MVLWGVITAPTGAARMRWSLGGARTVAGTRLSSRRFLLKAEWAQQRQQQQRAPKGLFRRWDPMHSNSPIAEALLSTAPGEHTGAFAFP